MIKDDHQIGTISTIVIVEDNFSLNKLIQIELVKNGFKTESLASGSEVLDKIVNNQFINSFFLFDFFLGDMTAKDIIICLQNKNIYIPYILMTGQGDENIAVEMMKLGAYDYTVKDIGFIKMLPTKIVHAIKRYELEKELKRSQARIVRSEFKYRSIFENFQDVYFELDRNNIFCEVSPSVKLLLGYYREELLNKDFSLLFNDENDKSFLSGVIKNSESINGINLLLKRKDGTLRNFTLNIQLLCSVETGDEIICGSLHDITELKETEKKMLNKIIETEEKERKHFAEDIHDYLGPLLSVLKIYLNILDTGTHSVEKKKELYNTAYEILDETIRKTKEISYNLIPNILTDFGLSNAIYSFCNKINLTGKVSIDFKNNCKIRFEQDKEIILYRTIIELINNTLKHSSANFIFINVVHEEKKIKVFYKDNGKGFDFNKVSTDEKFCGYGLLYLGNRIKLLNGSFDYLFNEGVNFQIEFEIEK